MSDHFLPFRRRDLHRLALESAPAGTSTVLERLAALLSHEGQVRLERLKDLYHPLDPNQDLKPVPPATSADTGAFGKELTALLERANFQAISQTELDHAFAAESLFQVKLHTELSDFAELTLYARGRRTREETITSWFGWRKKTVTVAYAERILLFVRFQDAAHFQGKKPRKTPLPFTPGSTQLKLFANVPLADLEMLFPNSEVRMKTLDKALIGVPALIGIATMSAKILALLAFFWASLLWVGAETGLHHDPVPMSTLAAEAGVAIAAGVAVYLFIQRQIMRYRFTKMKFLKALSDNLYFRNLDNNAGAFHRLIDEAVEEEVKEAQLGWRFLLDGPATAADLDARIEAWFKNRLQTTVDFEVDDALGKLGRLGLATEQGGVWTAVSPEQAGRILGERWQQVLDG